MNDEIEVVESKVSAEVQAEAAKVGWQAPDRFKGEAAKFVDADEYLRRAETVLPFVRDQNKKLSTDINDLRARLESEVSSSALLRKRLEDIDIEHSARLVKEVKKAREDAAAELAEAVEANDGKAVARLTREVARLETIEDEPKQAPDPMAFWKAPDVQRWTQENSWDEKPAREKREYVLVGQELRASGNRNVGALFMEDCRREIEKDKQVEQPRSESKVEGARQSGALRGSKKAGYDALSAEEKAACDADSRQFIGKGKKFADQAAYRAHWASIYQGME